MMGGLERDKPGNFQFWRTLTAHSAQRCSLSQLGVRLNSHSQTQQAQPPQAAHLYRSYPTELAALATTAETNLCDRLRADETEYERESVLRDFRRTALATLATVTNSSHVTNLGEDFVQGYVAERLQVEADALAENALLRRNNARRTALQHWNATVDAYYRQQWQMNRWQPTR